MGNIIFNSIQGAFKEAKLLFQVAPYIKVNVTEVSDKLADDIVNILQGKGNIRDIHYRLSVLRDFYIIEGLPAAWLCDMVDKIGLFVATDSDWYCMGGKGEKEWVRLLQTIYHGISVTMSKRCKYKYTSYVMNWGGEYAEIKEV